MERHGSLQLRGLGHIYLALSDPSFCVVLVLLLITENYSHALIMHIFIEKTHRYYKSHKLSFSLKEDQCTDLQPIYSSLKYNSRKVAW